MDVRFINTWHDPQEERTAAASLFDAGAAGGLHRRRHPGRRRRRQGEGQVGASPMTTRLLQGRRLPDRAVLDLGSRVRPHRQAGQGQDVQGRLRVLRRRLQGDGPVRVHGRPDAAEGHHRPSRGRRPEGQGHPRQDAGRHSAAGSTSSPGRSRTTPARRSCPAGAEARAVRPRPVPARRARVDARRACTGGPTGITVELPALTLVADRRRRAPWATARGPRSSVRSDGTEP